MKYLIINKATLIRLMAFESLSVAKICTGLIPDVCSWSEAKKTQFIENYAYNIFVKINNDSSFCECG